VYKINEREFTKALMYIHVGTLLCELKFFHYPNEQVKTNRKAVKISELLSKYDENPKNILSRVKEFPKSEKNKIDFLLKESYYDNAVQSKEFLDWFNENNPH